jgi:hypothetical protein
MDDSPDAVSPAFLRAIRGAQRSLPPFHSDDVVFYSPTDRVVDVRAIGERTPAANLVPYDGGHEFFASEARERTFSNVVRALEDGPDAFVPTEPQSAESIDRSQSTD